MNPKEAKLSQAERNAVIDAVNATPHNVLARDFFVTDEVEAIIASRIEDLSDALRAAEEDADALAVRVARVEALVRSWDQRADAADVGDYNKRERWVRSLRNRAAEVREALDYPPSI